MPPPAGRGHWPWALPADPPNSGGSGHHALVGAGFASVVGPAHRDAVASHRRRTGSVKVRSGRAHAPSTIARSTLLHPLAHFPKRFAPWYGQQQQR